MLARQLKTIGQRALVQAKACPNTRSIIMCGKATSENALWKFLATSKMSGFTYDARSRSITHKDGGKVMLRHADRDVREYAGYQISHLWIDEYVKPEALEFMRCRIRSTLEQKDPMGVYCYYGRKE
jgi:hypothetical protein